MSVTAVADEIVRLLGPRLGPGGDWVVRCGEGARAWIGVSDRFIIDLGDAGYAQVRLSVRGQGAARDQRIERTVMPGPLDGAIDDVLAAARWWAGRLTVYRLEPGRRYHVLEPFRDHTGTPYEPGIVLTFVEQHFLPYDDGHTLVFDAARIYLQGGEPVLDDFDRYLGLAATG